MAPQITRVGDLTVAVERPTTSTGKPPVLMIHGMFGGAWQWENYQAQLAQRGYASHAINLRGHHGSRPVRDIGKVSLDEFLVDAFEVVRTLKNPIVIGHSMGGLITQKVAEAGECRAAVLIAAAPPRWIPVASWLLLKTQLKYSKALLLHEPIMPKRKDADALMFNRTPVGDREKMYPKLVPESGKAGFELSFGVVAVHDSRVTAPVLVVTGLDDQFIVPRVARAISRKYGAPLREYQSFAHHILTEPGWEGPCGEMIEWMDRQ